MIVRYEAWGAWVKLETTPAIVALDRDGVRALGLDGGAFWRSPPRWRPPLEVHLAVTSRCGAGCKGCYLDARVDGAEPPRKDLEAALDAMRDAGVFTVAFGGGEPITRDDLGELALAARSRGLTPVLTTSGLGLTAARVERLRAFAQVNVSYDGSGATYSDVRGFDGAAVAESAIARLAEAGVYVGINVVLTRESFPRLVETVSRARGLGAREAQLLRYKPAGRAASLDYLARRLLPGQARDLGPTLRSLAKMLAPGNAGDAATRTPGDVTGPGHELAGASESFGLRIDCALVPFLSADVELGSDPARLTRFGVFGCEAAGALAAVTVEGRIAPCSFAPASALPAPLLANAGDDDDLAPWRSGGEGREPCASCPIRSVCKGGCKVVTSFLTGHGADRSGSDGGALFGPDPECPRVLAAQATRKAAPQTARP